MMQVEIELSIRKIIMMQAHSFFYWWRAHVILWR